MRGGLDLNRPSHVHSTSTDVRRGAEAQLDQRSSNFKAADTQEKMRNQYYMEATGQTSASEQISKNNSEQDQLSHRENEQN